MIGTTRKLLTIVTEAALEKTLIKDFEALSVHGYTITDARGAGSRGARAASWDPSGNIRVEVLCEESAAAALTAHLRDSYYDNYAMILFLSDVEVLRPEKF